MAGQYVVSVSAAAILCGVVLSLVKDGGHAQLMKLLCGVFLTITALSPISQISLPELSEISLLYVQEAEDLTARGEMLAEEAIANIIKAEIEAYILDKAASLGLTLRAEVTVESGIPTGVCLHGSAAPYQVQQMERMITEELGISKENLQWTGIS